MSPRRPRLIALPCMCDTHVHVNDASIPAAPGGPPLPGQFSVPMYRELQKRLGMSRAVVVQANAHQDDNRVVPAAIKELGEGAKGVAVVKRGIADAQIERLTKAGVSGQRIFQPAGRCGEPGCHGCGNGTLASFWLVREHPGRRS